MVDELLDLSATLADQGDDVYVGLTVASNHAQQRALADTGAGEDAHALTSAAGEQTVQSTYTSRQRGADRLTTEWARWPVGDPRHA